MCCAASGVSIQSEVIEKFGKLLDEEQVRDAREQFKDTSEDASEILLDLTQSGEVRERFRSILTAQPFLFRGMTFDFKMF